MSLEAPSEIKTKTKNPLLLSTRMYFHQILEMDFNLITVVPQGTIMKKITGSRFIEI